MARNTQTDFWVNDFDGAKHATISIWRQQFLAKRLLALNPTSILELGCNLGENLAAIHKQNSDIKLYGMDVSANAIKKGKKKFNFIDFSIGDICDIKAFEQFADNSIDIIFTSGVLIYVPDEPVDIITEQMCRIAKRLIIHMELNGERCYRHQRNCHNVNMYAHSFKRHYKKYILTKYVSVEELSKEGIVAECAGLVIKDFRNLGEARHFITINKVLKNIK